MTKKNTFGDIKKKAQQQNADVQQFINEAQVHDKPSVTQQAAITTTPNEPKLDPGARRGASYKDKKTGEVIKLGGRNLPVPLNAYELDLLTKAALDAGMPISTFVRVAALEKAKS